MYRRVLVNGSEGWIEKQPPEIGSSSRAKLEGESKLGRQSQSREPSPRHERRRPAIADERVIFDCRLRDRP
jgi:hypothetical protein